MRVRHQALTIPLAGLCLCGGGCARLLGFVMAPQEAAMSAAGSIADSVAAPARGDLAGVTTEVDRLLSGQAANHDELMRIKQELERRLQDPQRGDAAQDEQERLRPWHPRVGVDDRRRASGWTGDDLRIGRSAPVRGLAKHGPLPDGIADGELAAPLDLSRVRLGPPQR